MTLKFNNKTYDIHYDDTYEPVITINGCLYLIDREYLNSLKTKGELSLLGLLALVEQIMIEYKL